MIRKTIETRGNGTVMGEKTYNFSLLLLQGLIEEKKYYPSYRIGIDKSHKDNDHYDIIFAVKEKFFRVNDKDRR